MTVAIEMNRTQAVRALLARGPVDLTSPLEVRILLLRNIPMLAFFRNILDSEEAGRKAYC